MKKESEMKNQIRNGPGKESQIIKEQGRENQMKKEKSSGGSSPAHF